ncbi:unnamed protein product [Schistosoma curassoni]|uniref:Reverse transcriptase domain-containing protein n=1 Tax=Schistosoma curassoni TaxID=6186 RepID=A0A183JKU7_9TREM|nr:unnamed protein product [Schistosoma curassoni]
MNLTNANTVITEQFTEISNLLVTYAQSISNNIELQLRTNPDIVLLKPDKGSGVVIMNKCEYKSKMLSILSDESKFIPGVEFGGIGKLEGRVNSNLEKLLHMNVINKEEFNFLKPMGSEYLHLYGLPKIHKQRIPLRPILSMCRSPTHNLHQCKYSLTDSFKLVDHLGDINIKEKTTCSFDVNSLFTNVPLKKYIDILCDYISLNNLQSRVPVKILKDLLLLCTDNVQFTFEGEYFRQIDGVAMGSLLGPLLADVFMAHVENLADGLIENMSRYKRYVDDILVVC